MNKKTITEKNIMEKIVRVTRFVAMVSVFSLGVGVLLCSTAQGNPTSEKGLPAGPAKGILTTGEIVSNVRSVELINAKGGIIVRTNIEGRVLFTHQIIPSKDGKPYRIILDCLNADHKLGGTNFINLPKSIVTSIRSSQFAVKPERICRIVLDLEKEALYRVIKGPTYVDIFVTDNTERHFSSWSSIGTNNVAPVKELKAKTKTVESNIKTAKMAVAEPSKGKTADLKPEVKITVAKTAKASQQTNKINAVEKKAVVSAKTNSEKASDRPSGGTVASKGATEKSGSDVAVVSKPAAGAKAKNEAVKTKTQPVVANKKSAQNSPSAQFSNTAPSKKSDVKKSVKQKTISATLASKPVTQKSKAKKVEKTNKIDLNSKKAIVAVNNTINDAKSIKPSSKKSVKNAPTTLKIATRGESEIHKVVETNRKTDQKKVTSNVASKPSGSALSRTDKANTAKFRRVAERVAKLKGTRIAEFPKRLVIKYNSYNTDDPFATLIDKNKVNNKPNSSLIPNVENLLMVGVLQGKNNKNRGLFEDQDGRGYILKPGDKVENGTVLKVTSEKAYFQIFEYGWSRTVSLQLHE